MAQFLRADTFRFKKIGKNRPKLQKWRKPRGKHNKIRRGMAGNPPMPSIGYRGPAKDSGKIKGLIPMLVNNMKELDNATAKNIVIISSRIGAKKKMEMIKKATEMKLKIQNMENKK